MTLRDRVLPPIRAHGERCIVALIVPSSSFSRSRFLPLESQPPGPTTELIDCALQIDFEQKVSALALAGQEPKGERGRPGYVRDAGRVFKKLLNALSARNGPATGCVTTSPSERASARASERARARERERERERERRGVERRGEEGRGGGGGEGERGSAPFIRRTGAILPLSIAKTRSLVTLLLLAARFTRGTRLARPARAQLYGNYIRFYYRTAAYCAPPRD